MEIKDKSMANAAYNPIYLKQRSKLENLLFQENNFTEDTINIISNQIVLRKRCYEINSENPPSHRGGSENLVSISDREVYSFRCLDDNCEFCKLIYHSNGKQYLVFRRDLYGYSLLEIETLKDFHYYPTCVLGYHDNEDFEEAFIWTDVLYNSNNNLMVVYGCYWACPWGLVLVDFSNPFQSAENQVCITFKKEVGSIKSYFWQGNTLVINSIHSKWMKGYEPKKGQSFNGIYREKYTIKTNKTHKISENICRKWLFEANIF